MELIAVNGLVDVHAMAELCQRVLGGFGMPVDRALNLGVPIYKGKGAWNDSGGNGVGKNAL